MRIREPAGTLHIDRVATGFIYKTDAPHGALARTIEIFSAILEPNVLENP